MTRINAGVLASELPGKLLLAEHREITRIPNAIKSGRAKVKDIPEVFRLGPGHVKFFYNKLLYLRNRYLMLNQECRHRGYNITDKFEAFEDLPDSLMNSWTVTPQARQLIIERIESKGFKLLV